MINTKVIFTISLLSLLYSGCTESEKPQEKKVEASSKSISEPKIVPAVESKKIEKPTPPSTPIAKKIVAAPTGKSLFKKCQACHGINAEKKALNKSEIIQAWDANKIANALNGYQSGTYGGTMKGLMQSQVAKLSDHDIQLLSKYIASLKK